MILIRGDGNARIGVGHLMRCMTIAEEMAFLQGSREQICFVCADEASGAFVREKGFRSHVLGTDYRDMESELPLWKRMWEEWMPGETSKRVTVLVDSYYVTDRYLAELGKMTYTVLMDDYGSHCYPADCVINYNAPADPETYGKLYQGSGTKLLIGSRYTPLRRQFRREETEQARHQVHEVLITTGGGDSGNIAGEILKRIYRKDITFHLVTGRFHPNFRELQEPEQEHANIKIHHDVKHMAELMGRCQIALTAGGTTIYELAALGVPFICFSYAENQEALVEYIGKRQIAGSAGAWHREPEQTLEKIGVLFAELAENFEKRECWRSREKEMIDGEGAERLARELLERVEGGRKRKNGTEAGPGTVGPGAGNTPGSRGS